MLRSVLGQSVFTDLEAVFLRAIREVSGAIYSVSGGKLFRVSSQGDISDLGAVAKGPTSISGNNGKVTVAANGVYYVFDGTNLQRPDTGAFSSVGSVDFLGQYTLITEKDGRKASWSTPADPETFDALDVKTKEGADEDILRGKVINGYWWLFSAKSSEIWYQTGQAGTNAFTRMAGQTSDIGLKAYDLIVDVPDGAFFVGSDNRARLTNGGESTPVSTTAVEQSISDGVIRSCGYYEDAGHSMCVIAFDDRPAWCLDLATGEWHERSQSVNHKPWSIIGTVQAYGSWFAAYAGGEIHRLERNNTDVGEALRRTMISETLEFDGQRRRIKSLEAIARRGSHSGQEPQLRLSTSKDHGKTWAAHTARGLGELGEYAARARWTSLGQYRQFTAQIDITAESEIPINAVGVVEVA